MSPNKPEKVGVQKDMASDELKENEGRIEVKVTDKRRVSAESNVDDDPPIESEESAELLQELQAKLQESEEKRAAAERNAEDLSDRFRKAQIQLRAENDEVRARLQRTFDQKLETARGDLIASLLDTLDNLQRALSSSEASSEKNYESLLSGVKATAEMFEAQLRKLGLNKVISEGEVFNPELHEAVELTIVPPEQDNRVVAELRPGYKFGERLLRPAQVRVGRATQG